MKNRVVIFILLILFFASCVLLVYLSKTDGFSKIEPLGSERAYRVYTEEIIPREELSLFMVTDDKIMLFFDYSGIVNVYSIEGKFLYGLQVEALKNGTGDMFYDDGYLYIHSRGNTMYIFQETALVRSFCYNDDPEAYQVAELLMEQALNHRVGDTIYSYNVATNVIEKREDGLAFQTVIEMPKQNKLLMEAATLACLLFAAIVVYIEYISGKQGNKVAAD